MPRDEALTESITIRLPGTAASALAEAARTARRSPAELARLWVLERLDLAEPVVARPRNAAVPDPATSAREKLRHRYRPDDVVVLFVGESAPAGGTFFYQADSRLFDATRDAFERAFGQMPAGAGFLERFMEMGFWLYDLVEAPVNRMPGRPRKSLVDAGVAGLAEQIRELEPDFVVAVKTSLAGVVQQAGRLAGFEPRRIRVFPFPAYQWRDAYVRNLAHFLNRDVPADGAAAAPAATPGPERLTLHEAMAIVLGDHPGETLSASALADEVAGRGLYERRDGGRADRAQVLLRARKYGEQFIVGARGISLRDHD